MFVRILADVRVWCGFVYLVGSEWWWFGCLGLVVGCVRAWFGD